MNYTVKLGDTLGTIAARFLGASSRFSEILKANPQITNPNVIPVGMVLKIPLSTSSASVSRTPASMPNKVGALVHGRASSQTSGLWPLSGPLLQNPRNLMLIGVALIGAYYFFGKDMYKRMGKS
jgi:hypothetical protein